MLFNAKRTGNEGGTTADIFLQNGMKVDLTLRLSFKWVTLRLSPGAAQGSAKRKDLREQIVP
jgi:hypothetical protein